MEDDLRRGRLELNFENEDALIDGLETSPSEYETSADEEDAKTIFIRLKVPGSQRSIEALSIEKLSVILRNPKMHSSKIVPGWMLFTLGC